MVYKYSFCCNALIKLNFFFINELIEWSRERIMKSDSVVDNSEKKKAQLFRLGYFIWFDYFQNFEYINRLRKQFNKHK